MNEPKPVPRMAIAAVTAVFSLILISSLVAVGQRPATAEITSTETPIIVTPIPPVDGLLSLSRFPQVARVGPAQQMVYGPNICTSYGDPFSPLNSVWAPGYYTYMYVIVIPPDYPHDMLRVELFDPDSINTITQTVQVYFSDTAVDYDPDRFPAEGVEMTCPSDRRDPCILETGELEIVAETGGAISEAEINPYWYVRTDANRGAGAGHGNGTCAIPETYAPQYNTRTVYDLHYYAQLPNGDVPRIPLGLYTGQVGDTIRDTGDHQTDMRWVSPGGTQLPDQPVPVPAEFGSFEIDLTSDVPDIWVDPATGNRHIWLDITTISGASRNEFHLWAGPLYPNLASAGNARNLQIANAWPFAYDSAGVEVKALGDLPQVSHEVGWAEKPLLTVGPEYAGSTIFVGTFDLDDGSQPPLVFSFDSLAFAPADNDMDGIDHDLTDWALAFGGTADPNPESRCFHLDVPGDTRCTNQWVSPPYVITIPSDLNCDYQDPDMANCTPFYGGTLSVRYRAGFDDAAVWEMLPLPTVEPDPTLGCSAFPITPHFLLESVSPDVNAPAPFPQAWEFEYPPTPPTYGQFPHNQPGIDLIEAQPGLVYRAWINDSSALFLRWNAGIEPSLPTLVNSLSWPGDTRDYTDHGDNGLPIADPYPHVVRGFVDYYDNTDLNLAMTSWIPAYTDDVNDDLIRNALNQHIDRGRLLRLPIWYDSAGSGMDTRVSVYRFGLFQLHGYRLSPQPWLLLEFAGWDDSCGQSPSGPPPIPTMGPTATFTPTPDPVITLTPTSTGEPTATSTSTATATNTPTSTPTVTATATNTATPTATVTPTATAVPSPFYHFYLPLIVQQ